MKVFISTTKFGEEDKTPLQLLLAHGIEYLMNPYGRKLEESEVKDILNKNLYSGLIAGTESLTVNVLENAKSLKVISRVGVGVDNIDLVAAQRLGIKIFNTPDVLTDSVAELTIGLVLSCLRKINLADKNIKNGIWRKNTGYLFKGKVIGIIGFGRIGRKVADLSEAFGAKVLYYDINNNIERITGTRVSLDELISSSDIITIHSSAKERFITAREIAKMKLGTVLINTSRGSAIDETALYDGLSAGKLSYAGLDVYDCEPYLGKLCSLDNVVLTPHIGSYAKEARIQMETEAVNNLLKGLAV